jgi:hypothetical protein
VTFYDGSSALGTADLDDFSSAKLSTSALGVGSHTITAQYVGDKNYFGSTSAAVTQVVIAAPGRSSIILTSSAASLIAGQPVTFTATLSTYGSTGTLHAGYVTFYDSFCGFTSPIGYGGWPFGSSDTVVTWTAGDFGTATIGAVGSHIITAVYSGDNTFQGSTSTPLTLTVVYPVQTLSITMNSSAASVAAGQLVTFTATASVAAMYGLIPTGSIAFYDGNTYLGSGNLQWDTTTTGSATLTTSALGVGSHNITASYGGDGGTFLGSTSTPLAQTVTGMPVTPPYPQPGTPPALLGTVANGLTHSYESYANFVIPAYQNYLGRNPAASEVNYWAAAMNNGLSDERVEAGFIGSPEYIAQHGGSGAGWVRGMYQDLLGRVPTLPEVDGWVRALNNGMPATAVAYGFAASYERESERVAADYSKYLGRAAATPEIEGWVRYFESGGSNENVIAGFVGSPEYFHKHSSSASVWLDAAYKDILGRPADPGAYSGWLPVLGS